MIEVSDLLPWQTSQWERFITMVSGGRFPHALLLRGRPGVGKAAFAERAANALLCNENQPAQRPCGRCRACCLFAAATHPDWVTISVPEDKKNIGIEQIRDLIAWMALTPQFGGFKVSILVPAERMTKPAANSLLKTLEEPPGQAAFFLVSNASTMLPGTVRSRCQFLDFPTASADVADDWLKQRLSPEHDSELLLDLAHGAPLAALRLAEDGRTGERVRVLDDLVSLSSGDGEPVGIAGRWKRLGTELVLDWLVSLSEDLIRIRSVNDTLRICNRDLSETMQHLAERLDLIWLFAMLDRCLEAREALESRANLSEQLLLEGIAIGWASGKRAL